MTSACVNSSRASGSTGAGVSSTSVILITIRSTLSCNKSLPYRKLSRCQAKSGHDGCLCQWDIGHGAYAPIGAGIMLPCCGIKEQLIGFGVL